MQNQDILRYERQIILPFIGEEGQKKLGEAKVLVVGCGGLGCHLANYLVRAGIGKVRIVDKDRVSLQDLQRQILYDEEDVKSLFFKAKIASEKLKKVNSTVRVEAFVLEVKPENIEELLKDIDLVLDGTDNIKTRLLINEACIKYNIPWVHGAVQGAVGMSMTIIPGKTACYRCLVEENPQEPEKPIPILNTIPALVASIQVTEAFKIITKSPDVNRDLVYIDLWESIFRKIKIKRRKDCPVCEKKIFNFI
ncbi:HesA/MoeB/ThiF family protein [Candidatus Aerophobetes bacterium]|uniref:HesA/MoeB/ThiF family protein n=1 Tax=Aerophobetes bacterium TaxID=2030807 RepID=A0A7V5HZF9_UNCAE|nr:HesA/MoeB/ThiF family protein [Candidatus Aerophobetes bacterium]HHF98758.1 HesA/MoeB/ThiF family protein [Candidatus Aerophobetes bacterium]